MSIPEKLLGEIPPGYARELRGTFQAKRTLAKDKIIILIILFISGNPATNYIGQNTVTVGVLALLFGLWLLKPRKSTSWLWLVLFFFFALLFLQLLTFGPIVLMSSMGVIVKLGISLLAALLLDRFYENFVVVISWLAVLSFFFWVPTIMGIGLTNLLAFLSIPDEGFGMSIVIHNFGHAGTLRNSGMFWEPGAFAGYLAVALFFTLISKNIKGRNWHILVIVLALISTQSTTGYLAGFIVGVEWFRQWVIRFNLNLRAIIVPVVATALSLSAFLVYSNVSLLGRKIEFQWLAAMSGRENSEINRIGNFLYDVSFITERPLVGWGATPQTRTAKDPRLVDFVARQGNGLTGFIVSFGFIGILVYLLGVYRGLRLLSGKSTTAIMGAFLVVILLTGEKYLNFPFFYIFMFYPLRNLTELERQMHRNH